MDDNRPTYVAGYHHISANCIFGDNCVEMSSQCSLNLYVCVRVCVCASYLCVGRKNQWQNVKEAVLASDKERGCLWPASHALAG